MQMHAEEIMLSLTGIIFNRPILVYTGGGLDTCMTRREEQQKQGHKCKQTTEDTTRQGNNNKIAEVYVHRRRRMQFAFWVLPHMHVVE